MKYYELFERNYEDLPVGHILDNTGVELEVHTEKVTNDDGTVRYQYKVKEPGTPRGVNMATATSTAKGASMMSVGVHPEFRGRGIADALYDFVEKTRGMKLEPNAALTPDGEQFWKKRIQRNSQ